MLLRRAVTRLRLAMAGGLLSAAAILIIPLTENAEGRTLANVIALAFWVGLIWEQILFWMANSIRKKIQSRRKRKPVTGRPGIFTFGANPAGLICDVVMGLSLVATVLWIVLDVSSFWLVTATLAVLWLTLNLHCIVNGKTYRYISAIQKSKKGAEKNEKK